MKRHAYRYFGITWSWRPLGPSFGAAPCEMCRLSFTAKVHRRLR